MGPIRYPQTISCRRELTFLIPQLIRTPKVNFNRPKPSQRFIALTLGIWVAHRGADFELLVEQGFVFLKLVVPRLKFHHLLPGLCVYAGMEGDCLLHRHHLGPGSSFQGLRFGLPNGCSEQDGLVAQVDPEIVKGIVGLPFTKRHLQGNQILCHASSASINPKVTVPIAFVAKVCNVDLDRFKKDIGQEVYIIAGDRKGYRATLRSFGVKTCIVAPYGQTYIELDLCDVVTRYGRLNGAMLEGQELASFCDMRKRSSLHLSVSIIAPTAPSSSVWSTWPGSPGGLNLSQDLSLDTNPSSSTLQAWSVDQLDIQDSNDALADTIKDSGPIPWLKEFSSTFFKYHAMLSLASIRRIVI
ncbi:hypothetical protein EDD22DRAFT_960815 [Suillus occidentalis]|nr:hypothetical protein EDD22DRAFT_960815 [Suillus occidentalis]